MAEPHQFGFCLPRRSPDDYLREQLAERVERMNASVDPAERVELFREIETLRSKLRGTGGVL